MLNGSMLKMVNGEILWIKEMDVGDETFYDNS